MGISLSQGVWRAKDNPVNKIIHLFFTQLALFNITTPPKIRQKDELKIDLWSAYPKARAETE